MGGANTSGNIMLRIRLVFFPAVALLAACAVTGSPKTCFHSNTVESQIGYCQAVRSGNMLYISGTVGEGAMPAAIRMAYDSLKATLEAHGLSFRNVVNEHVYTTDLDAFIKHKEIRKQYYATDFPAASWVQVERLYVPSFVVEVTLTAEFPQNPGR
jgi:2-iminobutanoate/2-iminopropanoate deaminase